MKRPTVEPHFGVVENSKTFEEAFNFLSQNEGLLFRTNSGKEFTAEARITKKGPKKGKRVIVFKQSNKEYARSYSCCWGSKTNCNRTYIDPYTDKL